MPAVKLIDALFFPEEGEKALTLFLHAPWWENTMSLKLILAASLIAAFVAWYVFSLIPGRTPRGILRATLIALLCSPGIIVGHGFAVVPSLFALYAQPSIFTLCPMLIVWVIALGIIFSVPALRNHSSAWPLLAKDIFLGAYALKFVFFGVVAAVLMLALIYSDQRRTLWVVALKYGLFFAGAMVNLTLCYWASRAKQASPFLTPLFFSVPMLFATAPTVPFMWYGGGAIGGLIGSGRRRIAAWISLGVFTILFANAMFRIYLAATAPSHVVIGGGVAGNAALAAVFAGMGIVAWWTLRRHERAESNTTTI